MQKIKEIMKWIATDGLLHILACYACMLTLIPMVGVWWSLLATSLAALVKEVMDFFVQKDNDKEQVIHDLICDAVGIMAALITMLIWMFFA